MHLQQCCSAINIPSSSNPVGKPGCILVRVQPVLREVEVPAAVVIFTQLLFLLLQVGPVIQKIRARRRKTFAVRSEMRTSWRAATLSLLRPACHDPSSRDQKLPVPHNSTTRTQKMKLASPYLCRSRGTRALKQLAGPADHAHVDVLPRPKLGDELAHPRLGGSGGSKLASLSSSRTP